MNSNSQTWAMLIHFSVFLGYVVPFAGLIAPILIWQLKKEDFPEIEAHGKMVLNFLISMLIYSLVAFLLTFVFVGLFLFFALMIVGIVFPIIGGIKANNGVLWTYPGMLQLVK
ncbi:MAG: DUF4870 domain-containing protein [Pirellulaceae bacterium]|nr:DUF4870 domain-containing protein [Pirellulaceae bacterium]